MWDIFDSLNVPGLSIGGGMITLPLWAMAALLAVLALFVVMTFVRGGLIGLTVLIALVAIAVGTNWVLAEMQRMQGRRALEARLTELGRNALVPGSALACLGGNVGVGLERGCEQAVFATPQSVAAARAYSAARLAVLTDGTKFAARQDPEFDDRIRRLRVNIEQDRFGIASHVLMTDNGCSADQCDALALLRDPTRLRTNMREKTFDALLARYAPAWTPVQRTTEAPAPQADSVPTTAPNDSPPPGASASATAPAANAEAAPMPQRRPPPPPRTAARPRPPASPPVAFSPVRP